MESAMSVDFPLDNIRIKEFPTINLAGGVDFDLDEIRIKELAPINIGITELPDLNLNAKFDPLAIGITQLPDINLNAKLEPIKLDTDSKLQTVSTLQTDSTLKTDSILKTDSTLDLDLSIKELPQLDVQLGLRPVRIHLPLSYLFCLTVFGIKVFEFKTCGEGMVIAEDYKEKSAEHCE
jgi:hypothetical protein